jgi:hypothetical protein
MPNSQPRFILNEGQIVDTANRFASSPECACETCQQLTPEQRRDEAHLRRCLLKARLAVLTSGLRFLNQRQADALGQIIYLTIYISGVDLLISRDVSTRSVQDSAETEIEAAPPELTVLSQFIDDVSCLLRDLYEDCDGDLLGDIIDRLVIMITQWDAARSAMSRSFCRRLKRMGENIDCEAVVTLAAVQREASLGNYVSPAEMENWTSGLNALDHPGLVMLAAKLLEGKPYAVTGDDPDTVRRCLPLAEFIGASIQSITESDGITQIVFGPPSEQRIAEHLAACTALLAG